MGANPIVPAFVNSIAKQEMKTGNQRIAAYITLAACCVGCAPRFIDVVPPAEKQAWVQRPLTTVGAVVGPTKSLEIVHSKVEAEVVGPEERVRWISGVNLQSSRLQRASERGVASGGSWLASSEVATASALVHTHQFAVIRDSVSVEGQLALQKFTALPAHRFYVEFLNSGRMTEASESDMATAWRSLSQKLKEKGLNTSNVVLGGSKYQQAANAIVLVRVGK